MRGSAPPASAFALICLVLAACGQDAPTHRSGVQPTEHLTAAQPSMPAPAPAGATVHAEPASGADQDTADSPSFGARIFGNLTAPEQAPSHAQGIELQALELAGEVGAGGALVERSYRARFINRGEARFGLEAALRSRHQQIQVVSGTLRIGELDAGESVTPHGTVVLRHPPELTVLAQMFELDIRATDAGIAAGGTLLSGRSEDPAAAALQTLVEPPDPARRPASVKLTAVLASSATVGQVNAALRTAGARIVEMRPDNRLIGLRMDWNGDRDAALRRIHILSTSPAFERVQPAPEQNIGSSSGTTDQLPPPPIPDPEPEFNDHKDV